MRSVPGFFHALFLQVHMWEKGFFIITRLKRSKQRRKLLRIFLNRIGSAYTRINTGLFELFTFLK